MYKSTRDASLKQEKKIAKAIGAYRTPNSGATPFYKGDLFIPGSLDGIKETWLIEAKTSMQPKKSFSIKQEWLLKMKEEQFACKKEHSALCFDFGDNGQRYYIIDENTFKNLIEK